MEEKKEPTAEELKQKKEKEKKSAKQMMQLCTRISIAFVIVMVVVLLGQLILIRVFADALWVKKAIQFCDAVALLSPFGIVIPLFFRVNFQNKLTLLMREDAEEKKVEDKDRS